MSTSPLIDQSIAEIERLEDALDRAREIIAGIGLAAYHGHNCQRLHGQPCDCGLDCLLQMADEWKKENP